MLRTNYLKEKLEAGASVLGTWATIPSAITADIMASSGLDFLIIDAEHGPISFERAQEMVIACESRGVSPVMRIGSIDEADILKALDIGVHCILVPNIKSCEDVKKLVALCKYPPIGQRGFSPFTRAGNYSGANATSLTEQANANTQIAIIVEGEEAIRDIDSILQIPELDIVYIGLFDLSKALGIPGQVDDPKVLGRLRELTEKISAAGKYAGTISTNKQKMHDFLSMGVRFIVHLVDCDVLRGAYAELREHFDSLEQEKGAQQVENHKQDKVAAWPKSI